MYDQYVNLRKALINHSIRKNIGGILHGITFYSLRVAFGSFFLLALALPINIMLFELHDLHFLSVDQNIHNFEIFLKN